MEADKPLTGIRVVEHASGVAAAQAGRLLCQMGAEVVMVEPPEHSPLRFEPPLVGAGEESALFTFLSAGKRSVICDPSLRAGRDAFDALLASADILIDDTPLSDRDAIGLDAERIGAVHPKIVHLSILPFGAFGPKSHWKGEELNLIHAGGEGFLLPNGLSADLFPDRPPLKIAGHFAEMQGGTTAAFAALSALWVGEGQFVDVSVQDANVAVGAFAIQRFGDGSVEHRLTRSFRYGGVIECRDGYVELLMLEERQWQGLVELMGRPSWAADPELGDGAGRSGRGDEINAHIHAWARDWLVEDLVAGAQELGVPMARYNEPHHILTGPQETARGIFHDVELNGGVTVKVQSLPFRFGAAPLAIEGPAPSPGADQALLEAVSVTRRATA